MKLNKKQKRTATIASMAALLAVVLGMGGQTFAKYITTENVEAQTATVAKWGFVINSDVSKLFAKTYGTDTDGNELLEAGTSGDSVVTTGSSSVVAPGTEGYMTLVISGKAEVKSSIKVEVADVIGNVSSPLAKATDIHLNNSYNPLKWTITNNGAGTTVTDGTLASVESYLENLSNNSVAANTEIDYDLKISWKWAFDVDEATNIKDTRLGDLKAMSKTDYEEKYGADTYDTDTSASSLSFSFAMKVTVAQIQ